MMQNIIGKLRISSRTNGGDIRHTTHEDSASTELSHETKSTYLENEIARILIVNASI